MQSTERMQLIQQLLQAAFSPSQLQVIDDSEKHKGHAGSRDGAGHYTLIICSALLSNKSRIEAHREIYAVLADFIPHEIHALQIKVIA